MHRLRLLRELKLRGTLTAVAQALGYSPSSVSHQLAVLEREVGLPLLAPRGRGVRLTAAAETLVQHADAIVLHLEQAEAAIAASREEVAGTVRIATFQTAAHALLPRVLALLDARHPRLEVVFVHLAAQAAVPALIARDFDLVLAENYPGASMVPLPAVVSEQLLPDPLLLVIPAHWDGQQVQDLQDAPWAMEPSDAPARRWSVEACRAAGFEPRIAFESADVLLHARLAAQGRAAAFLPALVRDSVRDVRLVPTGVDRQIMLVRRRGGDVNPAVQAARAALHQVAAARG